MNIRKLLVSYIVLGTYFFTLFVLSLGITVLISRAIGITQNMDLMVFVAAIVILILGSVDFHRIFQRKWSPTMIVWSLFIMIYLLLRAIGKKQRVVTYDTHEPPKYIMDIVTSAISMGNNPKLG